jgi:thioredoxin-related protein
MKKNDISIFLFAVLVVVFIYKIETNYKEQQTEVYGYQTTQNENVVTTYEEALILAKEKNKPIFIYFEAEWCGYCKQMKKNVLSNREVKNTISQNYIELFIDIDSDPATKSLFRVKSVPTYLICSPDGDVIQKHSGYQDVRNFLKWLEPKNTASKLN